MCSKKFSKRLFIIILFVFIVCLLTAIPFSVLQKKDASSQITMKIDNLHNGDAKFFGENIITSVDNVLKLYSLQGDLIKSYDSVCASWLDVLPNEGIVLYGGE